MSATRSIHDINGKYKVEVTSSKLLPIERHPQRFTFCLTVTWVLWVLYTLVTFCIAGHIQRTHGQGVWLWRMWAALLAELALSFPEAILALSTLWVLFSVSEYRTRPRCKLLGNSVPSVDVMLPCCGEPIDVILNTLDAIVKQDYVADKLNIFVLDDGHDENLRQAVNAVAQQSCAGPTVRYMSRKVPVGEKSFFKAGNLNFGIRESARLHSAEFVASLDADMIPERGWLRRMVPHLLQDDSVALAVPPQRYYNVPRNDPFGQQAEFDLYFTTHELVNDYADAAMCTGSGFLVRRTALTGIGGWPLVHAGEDFMCSQVLSNSGWKIAFVREYLQLGLAPESMLAHVKQRMRWEDAGVEVHHQFGFYIWPTSIKLKLSLEQKVVGILQAMREYSPVTNCIALIVLPIALFPLGTDPFVAIPIQFPRSLLFGKSVFLVMYSIGKICNFVAFSHIGLRRWANYQSNHVWCAPYQAIRCIASLIPESFNPPSFAVSGATISKANERDAKRRSPLLGRILNIHILLCFAYAFLAFATLLLRIRTYFRKNATTRSSLFPFPGAMLKLLDVSWKAAVPVWYMCFPPTLPERSKLMEMDEYGVKRPKRKWLEETQIDVSDYVSFIDVCELCILLWCF